MNSLSQNILKLPSEIQKNIGNALGLVKSAFDRYVNAINKVLPLLSNLEGVSQIPSVISEELTSAARDLFNALREVVSNIGDMSKVGDTLNTVMPETISTLPKLFKAMFKDAMKSPLNAGSFVFSIVMYHVLPWPANLAFKYY